MTASMTIDAFAAHASTRAQRHLGILVLTLGTPFLPDWQGKLPSPNILNLHA
jgi:hypothetical protein